MEKSTVRKPKALLLTPELFRPSFPVFLEHSWAKKIEVFYCAAYLPSSQEWTLETLALHFFHRARFPSNNAWLSGYFSNWRVNCFLFESPSGRCAI